MFYCRVMKPESKWSKTQLHKFHTLNEFSSFLIGYTAQFEEDEFTVKLGWPTKLSLIPMLIVQTSSFKKLGEIVEMSAIYAWKIGE